MMKLVIGYQATPQGIDALALGVDLARILNAELEIIIVLRRSDNFSYEYPPTGTSEDILLNQAFSWLHGAIEQIPHDVKASGKVFSDTNTAQGLERAAGQLGASLIVVGGSSASPLKRHRLGTIAHDLLFGAHFPIALAPRGYSSTPIQRLNCAVGLRPGAGSLVGLGVRLSRRANLPLRFIAFLGKESEGNSDTVLHARENVQKLLTEEQESSTGKDLVIVEKLEKATWEQGDIVFIGSSRVAEKNSVFAGSFAMRLLRELTLPLIVVPRGE
ncbi:universal stress protein [Corynebacterium sp. sy039]|uniref:universal stress protein n=1 Tax=Corynebacterium sp. sy039 TaxID=2599641 RepID=UPI0011B71B86|nr:universal stress protein [Corynebacterium sp. sy039]QDZ43220.1 universal stress protein [Corynebacterium sp. sy039]